MVQKLYVFVYAYSEIHNNQMIIILYFPHTAGLKDWGHRFWPWMVSFIYLKISLQVTLKKPNLCEHLGSFMSLWEGHQSAFRCSCVCRCVLQLGKLVRVRVCVRFTPLFAFKAATSREKGHYLMWSVWTRAILAPVCLSRVIHHNPWSLDIFISFFTSSTTLSSHLMWFSCNTPHHHHP